MTPTKTNPLGPWGQIKKAMLRIAGRDLPAGQQIAQWAGEKKLPIQATGQDMDDPGLILPRLRLSPPQQAKHVAPPAKRPAFAQLDEEQRWIYMDWLTRRDQAPDVGYAYLYLYGLEAGLFSQRASACCAEIELLLSHCNDQSFQARAFIDLALSAWLTGNAELYIQTIENLAWDGPYTSALLWMQAKLGLEITPYQLIALSPACGYTLQTKNNDRLYSYVQVGLKLFEENNSKPFLRYFAEQLGDPNQTIEIRLSNPAARFILTSFDVLGHAPFQQAVVELATCAERETMVALPETLVQDKPSANQASAAPQRGKKEWYAVIEFGESPSDSFDKAIALAKKQRRYTRLLDEKRNLIHRVIFRHNELGPFWALLDLVKAWKSTHVYINGVEREPNRLWPYMRLN